MKTLTIGVLALQGDFAKHMEMLTSLGAIVKEVRKLDDLEGCDGLIIPGGESTVMMRQIDFIQMREALVDFAKQKPVFGTCAGLILMSKQIKESPMKPMGLLDIMIERNAFGRQIDSFQAFVEVSLELEHKKLCKGFFIRAPRIRKTDESVKVLGLYENEPVLVQQGHHLGASFHPELTSDPTIHEYFLKIVQDSKS